MSDSEKNNGSDGSIFEKVMPDSVKRRIEAGMETMLKDKRLKNFVGELKLPKEIVNHILHQVDETKQSAVGIIGKEMRLFLEKTNLSEELAKLLTQISFQIKTEVKFVPNNDAIKSSDKLKMKISGPKVSPIKNADK